MAEEKIDSGTTIVNQKGSEIGVIKKVYSENLARLELTNADSIAFDPVFITNIETTGRILKKKTATISDDANIFFTGASSRLNLIMIRVVEILTDQLSQKETKKALQYFEFDILTKAEIIEKLPKLEILGLIRGIELANKTAQDFIIKSVFQAAEAKIELKEKLAPEIIVDKLNQEKAFNRILWNVARLSISQAIKLKDKDLVCAAIDAIIEIGLKHLDIEYKNSGTSNDILYWQERIENTVFKYIAYLIMNLELDSQEKQVKEIKDYIEKNIKSFKLNSNLREQCLKVTEDFTIQKYEQLKPIELMHSGIRGFNLKVMSEKKAMKDISQLVEKLISESENGDTSIVALRKNLDKFTREIREVSREFQNIIFEIGQYLKKIEYGDSKVHDFYADLLDKIHKYRYTELKQILERINKKFILKEMES